MIIHSSTCKSASLELVIDSSAKQSKREARRAKARRYATSFRAMLRREVSR